MKVSLGECIVEGIEEFFKHFFSYIFLATAVYAMIRLTNPTLQLIIDFEHTNIVLIFLFLTVIVSVGPLIIYYLVTKVTVNFVLQLEEDRKTREELKNMKRNLYLRLPKYNVIKHLGNCLLLLFSIAIIILSRELSVAVLKAYNLSDHFLPQLFLNLILGYIAINLFFVYVIGPIKVKNTRWTFKIARDFSLKTFPITLQFFTFIILNVLIVTQLYRYFKQQGTYTTILIFKVNTLAIEIPIMILFTSLFILYMIIHVIYTININRVHYKDKEWLLDTEYEYTNKW